MPGVRGFTERDRYFMELAIKAARKCKSDIGDPFVGAVAVLDDQLLGTAYRGQRKAGDHAEFTLLQKILAKRQVNGATIYTTLEPCTRRGLNKTPCVEWLVQRKVSRVVIGMLDPNFLVSGVGVKALRQANIVTDLFPPDLMEQLEELNIHFIQSIERNPIQQAVYDMGALARHSPSERQKRLISKKVRECADEVRRIGRGEIAIPGGLAGYLDRFVDLIEDAPQCEYIRAFIRLTAYDEVRLCDPMQEDFYSRMEKLSASGKVAIDYTLLLNREVEVEAITPYLQTLRRFAARVSVLHEGKAQIGESLIRSNIVLFQAHELAFIHERDEARDFMGATEILSPERVADLERTYRSIELVSRSVFEAPFRAKRIFLASGKATSPSPVRKAPLRTKE